MESNSRERVPHHDTFLEKDFCRKEIENARTESDLREASPAGDRHRMARHAPRFPRVAWHLLLQGAETLAGTFPPQRPPGLVVGTSSAIAPLWADDLESLRPLFLRLRLNDANILMHANDAN